MSSDSPLSRTAETLIDALLMGDAVAKAANREMTFLDIEHQLAVPLYENLRGELAVAINDAHRVLVAAGVAPETALQVLGLVGGGLANAYGAEMTRLAALVFLSAQAHATGAGITLMDALAAVMGATKGPAAS